MWDKLISNKSGIFTCDLWVKPITQIDCLNIIQICSKLFFKESAAKIGTLCASMNQTGKSNAKKGPDVNYNAFSNFTQHETDAHIIARWIVLQE